MSDIELVVKISEEDYINIKNAINSLIEKGVERDSMSKLCLAVLDGTPLPEGHGRLIDINEIDTAIYECFKDIQFYDGTGFDIYQEAKESIDKIHSIIEADKDGEGV